MATLDVSEVITDRLFTSSVRLETLSESFDNGGNPVWSVTDRADIQAVVTSDLKTLSRLPEALRREGTIMVRFMIKDKPVGFRGGGYDRVIWRGKKFVVRDCHDYSQFGQGFLRLICAPEESGSGEYYE